MNTLPKNTSFHAFCILAHKDPELVEILIEELKSIGKIYLHIDRNSLSDFSKLLARNDIFATSEVNVKWGHWSLVEATLILINRAIEEGAKRITLISGDSLPLASKKKLSALLLEDIDICHNRKVKDSGELNRDDLYFRRYFGFKNYEKFFPRFINFASSQWPFKINISKYLSPLELTVGSQWWSVTTLTMLAGLKHFEENPKLLKYFKKVKLSDELFFQTLVSHFSRNLNGTGTMYANWSAGNTPHPGDLDPCQIQEEFRSQKFYFARKFSTSEPKNLEVWRELYGTNKS